MPGAAPGTATVGALCFAGGKAAPAKQDAAREKPGQSPAAQGQSVREQVVREDALNLHVDGIGHYALMWTPAAASFETHQAYTFEDGVLGEVAQPEGLALALGFALSEGLIRSLADIRSAAICADAPNVVQMSLRRPESARAARRDVVVNSSCGICGPGELLGEKEILEENVLGLEPVPRQLAIAPADIAALMARMRARQTIFAATGGSHGAALFDSDLNLLAVAEDLGRHNALDKVIGAGLMQRGSLAHCGAALSSRLSLEMVAKALRAKLEILMAVSAPTSLAIAVAEKFGLTLCGFARDDRVTVYAHPERIRNG